VFFSPPPPSTSGIEVRAPITATPSTSLAQVIDTMMTNKIHRVYVVDQHGKPQGVVSLGDVLRSLVTLPHGFYEKFVLDK
jgi:CBS domain-containing protein